MLRLMRAWHLTNRLPFKPTPPCLPPYNDSIQTPLIQKNRTRANSAQFYSFSSCNTSNKSSVSDISANFTLDRYAARTSKCPDTGAVKKTKTIPRRSRTLMKCDVDQKYIKAPSNVNNTASVELFVAAWDLVYTSGKRIKPKTLITLIIAPIKISNAPINSPIALTFNDNTSLDKLCVRNCSYERQYS